MDKNNYIVEVEISPKQLQSINKVLGLAFSPKAKGSRPKTSLDALIRAVENKNLTNNYYEQ